MNGAGRTPGGWSRRAFMRTAAGAALAGLAGRAEATQGDRPRSGRHPSQEEPWGRLEPVGEGAWALVSTPLHDHPDARRTVCNGGIVAGRDGVVAVEGLGTMAGAAWLSDQALRLTGRRPTHVVLTHYHGDHTTGTAGYLLGGERPAILATGTTRRLIARQEAELPEERTAARPVLLPDVVLEDDGDGTTLDLGGRRVRLVPRRGHTASDLVLEVDELVWPGDLVWNGMFPNYMDAIPSQLAAHVRALRERGGDLWVSGHGHTTGPNDLDRYIDVLDHVEAEARRALSTGRPLDEAAREFRVPATLGEWTLFSPRYPEVAFRAWARELGGSSPGTD